MFDISGITVRFYDRTVTSLSVTRLSVTRLSYSKKETGFFTESYGRGLLFTRKNLAKLELNIVSK